MSMDTKQKLLSTYEVYLPQIIELLDMGETSLQKVIYFNFIIILRHTYKRIATNCY